MTFDKFLLIMRIIESSQTDHRQEEYGEIMTYTIGEMAKKLNITASALRYYDKEGLLPFVKRSDGGARIFKDEDFDWMKIIECLKKTGMPLKDIKEFIDWCLEGDSTIDQRLNMIREHQKAVEEQIQAMQENLKMIRYKRWYYEVAQAAGTCDVFDTITPDQIPEEFRSFLSQKQE